jgi:DNA polymerase-3 subunit gamma/tau
MQAQEAALHVIAQKSEGAMRDALSMLDRISGFTNGVLTYANTMEHLNLLDADFYFTLTDSLLSQDVSGALLLLNQALERGFEGDVILGGMSEHMRNLLLCKDARMAKLLDVPNDHKPVYYEKANQAPPSFILSSLNVLNESELSYKTATNKRLHTEICLIRLCYVLQATLPDSSEKKNYDSVATPQSVALVIAPPQVVAPIPIPAPAPTIVAEPEQVTATPVQPLPEPTPTPSYIPTTPAPPGSGRRISKNLITDIEANTTTQVAEVKELTQDWAQEVYEAYKRKLQSENKTVYHTQFAMMQVETEAPDLIKIIAPTELTETYAKEQRNSLIEFFRAEMKLLVRITTEVREDAQIQAQQQEQVMSKSEIYEAMAAKNPDLARLKDSLNMQLDY